MDGRSVAKFVIKEVPKNIRQLLGRNQMNLEDIDRYLFHQGSSFIVRSIREKLGLDCRNAVFDIEKYGNTVSSSIAILLEKIIANGSIYKNIVISGFGVGLSLSSAILKNK